jgi:DHA2 family multidrug resistance protein
MSPPVQGDSSLSRSAAGGRNPWLVISIATFMQVLDTSIANVALQYIAGSLAASVDESTWVLTSYLVASAVILPISGWLSGVIGRKRFYMLCVATFTVSSIPLRARAEPADAHFFPRAAGPRRRRHGAERAGHACRHVS